MHPQHTEPRAALPPTLVLIPTAVEQQHLALQPDFGKDAIYELCGFGPVAAAASTAHLLAQHKPDRVVLLGIAGTLYPRGLPIATAAVFPSVTLDGVGVGTSSDFISATDLGFHHSKASATDHADPLGQLTLETPASTAAGHLVTCCAASASPYEARQRRERFPEAVAEDMEGFGVALACRIAGIRVTIVRGISNEVGNRDRELWQISDALAAAWAIGRDLINRPNWST